MSHAFISYVTDDRKRVLGLARELRAAGIEAWLDREQLAPGVRWQDGIRDAIETGAYFVACFSNRSISRTRSYMNEELALAIQELRRRPRNRTWFVPVLLDEVKVPLYPIGAGETLQDIQYVALYRQRQKAVRRLIVVLRSQHVRVGQPRQPRSDNDGRTRRELWNSVLAVLSYSQPQSTSEIALRLGRDRWAVERVLREMLDNGTVDEIRGGRRIEWVRDSIM